MNAQKTELPGVGKPTADLNAPYMNHCNAVNVPTITIRGPRPAHKPEKPIPLLLVTVLGIGIGIGIAHDHRHHTIIRIKENGGKHGRKS
jgi:hypothetical protein